MTILLGGSHCEQVYGEGQSAADSYSAAVCSPPSGHRHLRAGARGFRPRCGAGLLPRRARVRGDALRRGSRGPLLVPGRRDGAAGAVDPAGRACRRPRRRPRPLRVPCRRREIDAPRATVHRRGDGLRGADPARARPGDLRDRPRRQRRRVLVAGHGRRTRPARGRRRPGHVQAPGPQLVDQLVGEPGVA